MECSSNGFCSSLPDDTRKKLCACCSRRFMKSGSMQLYDDYQNRCMLVIDGVFTSKTVLGYRQLDHEMESPALLFCLPGKLVNPHTTFFPEMRFEGYSYMDMTFLTDSWVATFKNDDMRALFDSDVAFARSVELSSVRIVEDLCQMIALLRANYTYYGVMHLMKLLASYSIYLPQTTISELMSRDRSSISKAFFRIKKENPELYTEYFSNKGRDVKSLYDIDRRRS